MIIIIAFQCQSQMPFYFLDLRWSTSVLKKHTKHKLWSPENLGSDPSLAIIHCVSLGRLPNLSELKVSTPGGYGEAFVRLGMEGI